MLGARQDSTFTWALSLFKWAGHGCQAARGALRWGSAVWPSWAALPSGAALPAPCPGSVGSPRGAVRALGGRRPWPDL